MSLSYSNLDARTRALMADELAIDVASGRLYVSDRLNSSGKAIWLSLLGQAAGSYDDAWLASEIQRRGLLNAQEARSTRTGGTTSAKVPVNAHETLAEGDFNRLYIRALCTRAIQDGHDCVVVYRARQSSKPRPESEAVIGREFRAAQLLDDLRTSTGVEPALGLPAVNSGLSVRLR